MKIGVGYCRISTENQLDNCSINEQKKYIKKYAEVNNITLADFFIDEAWSGENINRPSFTKMIDTLKEEKYECVIIYKLDRLSRRTKDVLYVIEDILNKNGIELISVKESLNTHTPAGMLFVSQLASFAQYELSVITERMQMGKMAKNAAGKWAAAGNTIPYGYSFINGELILNNEQAKEIRYAYDLFLQGYGDYTVHKLINEKYPGRNHWRNRAMIWHTLRKKVYAGYVYYRGEEYKGTHEAIVTLEEWEKVHSIRHKRAVERNALGKGKSNSLLTGLLQCGLCGSGYYKEQNRYCCKARRVKSPKWTLDKKCAGRYIKADLTDKEVIDAVKSIRIEDYVIGKRKNEVIDYSNDIKKIDLKIDKLIELYSEGGIEYKYIKDKLDKLKTKKEEFEILQTENKATQKEDDEILTALKIRNQILESNDIEIKKKLLKTIIEKIVVCEDCLEIHWKFW